MAIMPPDGFTFAATKSPDGLYSLVYEETFTDAELVKKSLKLLEAVGGAGGLKVTNPNPNTIHIEASRLKLDQLSNMMVGEFVQWSTLGQSKLADLLLMASSKSMA